jgi:heme-degrading monooxygenase HmoA
MEDNEMENFVFINPFEVQEGKEDEFLRSWQLAADYISTQPGFVSARLHRAISPDARFRFVNVAEWTSTEEWEAAISRSLEEVPEGVPFLQSLPSYPSFYEVVRAL